MFFKINNLEQSNIYTHYNLVIAETRNDFTSFKLVATLPISQETFTYTGNANDYKDLTANDVFFERPVYKSAYSVGKSSDYLFFTNLREYTKPSLQRVANKVKLYWQTKAITEDDLKDPRYANKFRGYLRDEVYAFAIVFEFKDDNDSIAFHIPGPSKEYFQQAYGINVDQFVTSEDVVTDVSCANKKQNKIWQVYNLAKVISQPHVQTNQCEDEAAWEWGDFSYWESERTYPNDKNIWGELCGQPIRHHKMPDSTITHFHDGLNADRRYEQNNIVYPLGIKVDHSSIIAALDWAVENDILSQEDRNRIKGYRIVRANRVGNKSIIAKGLLYDVWNYEKFNSKYYYPNFPYNDLRDNVLLAPTGNTYEKSNTSSPTPSTYGKTGRYTFHSPDIHFVNPAIPNIIKLETEEYGESNGFFNKAEDQAEYQILSAAARSLCFVAGIAKVLGSLFEEEVEIERQLKPDTLVLTTTALGSGTGIPVPDPFYLVPGSPAFLHNRLTGIPNPLALPWPTKTVRKDIRGSEMQLLNPAGIAFAQNMPVWLRVLVLGVTMSAGMFNQALFLLTRIMQEAEIFGNVLKKLVPKLNYSIQYNSIGKYNAYKPIENNGLKIREIETSQYLSPDVQTINEKNNVIRFNNWNRESSVFLKLNQSKSLFPNPTVIDNSRVSMGSAGLGYKDLNKNITRKISSFYGSLKSIIPDQYGSIFNLEYLETDGCSTNLSDEPSAFKTYFGGDTFISRFALKRKHPLFLQTRYKMLDNADVEYSELGNAAYPNFFIDYNEAFGERLQEALDTSGFFNILRELVETMIALDETRLDAKVGSLFYQKGYIHLYHYGIPYFLVESDINCFYRHGENNREKDFYPNNSDLGYWLQEKNVPITEDNYFFYNKVYSKQNQESFIKNITPSYRFNDEKLTIFDRRIVNSEKNGLLNENDNWLILKANSYKDIESRYGKIIGVDGIEEEQMIIRAENCSFLFRAYSKLQTTSSQIQIGSSDLYDGLKEFNSTELGFMGCQHRDMLKTEFGHVWADAKRGQVFLLAANGQGIEEISRYKMKNWFKQNLPFNILKDFDLSIYDIDNNFNNLGLHFSFDKKNNRFFMTKLDYRVKKKGVTYDKAANKFFIENCGVKEEVSFSNTEYFENKSWTIGYNFVTKSWSSFYSFTPNYYVDLIDTFESGLNSNGTQWSHNVSNKSYCVFYGEKHPFIIDVPSEYSGQNSFLENVEYVNDVLRYQNERDYFYNRRVTFNKAIIYNDRQTTGELVLIPRNEDDMSQVGSYPKVVGNSTHIIVTNTENNWRFNDIYDVVKSQVNNVPVWKYDSNNVNKTLNNDALNYNVNDYDKALIRGKNCIIRLINDQYTNYKFLFIFNKFSQNNSVR